MICITVAPVSRKLAKVDLLNAARLGDIIELCLDHLAKEPDVRDLISVVNKPVIVSCRRPQDGGHWQGSEDQRLMLLRQAIAAGPDYVELDLDVAARIPRFGATKRVISFTRMEGPETDIERVFNDAARHDADVVKYTWPTRTLDEAWPLMAAITQKRSLPIVGMGMGRPEITFSLLGQKYGSPWIYAALEHGMEAHEGQATVFDLTEVYDFHSINRQTQFVAAAGFTPTASRTIRIFNAGFRTLGHNIRCLPIEIGDLTHLAKMLDVLHVTGILAFGPAGRTILSLASHLDRRDLESQHVDLLLHRRDGWHGYNTLWRSGLKLLEEALGKSAPGQRPLAGKSVLIFGCSNAARSMAAGVIDRKGLAIVSGPDDKASLQIANLTGSRHVPFHNVYDTLADVVIVADAAIHCGHQHGCLNPALLRPGQVVMDVSDPPEEHALIGEARERGCRVIEPRAVYLDQVAAQFHAVSGEHLPPAALDLAGESGP